jgi:hypothetical protein
MIDTNPLQGTSIDGLEIEPLVDFDELSDCLDGLADLVLKTQATAGKESLHSVLAEAVEFATYVKARLGMS